MELWQLENAIRKQCLWNKDSNRRLQTDHTFEKKAELGQILFIGIAEMYGFNSEDVLNYIDIAPEIYKKRLARFNRAHHETQQRVANELPFASDFNYKIYIKTGLVQNYIKYHYNQEGYLTYRDILKG
jgi:hypothetical protein